MGTPPAEVEITVSLVQNLLTEQHPDLSTLPISALESGWDNMLFRLGDEYLVRMPRRELGSQLLDHELTWLPRLQSKLPIPIPHLVRVGMPGLGYPWKWSIVQWISGNAADLSCIDSSQAVQIAEFLKTLHSIPPIDAPISTVRGVPLRDRADDCERRMRNAEKLSDLINPKIWAAWEKGLNAPDASECCLLHGDLHPRNILLQDGVISGVIDWGDITSGDVATDLSSFWMLFQSQADREAAIAHYGLTCPDTIDRARGWAVHFGVIFLETGLQDNPRHARLGERILRQIAESG